MLRMPGLLLLLSLLAIPAGVQAEQDETAQTAAVEAAESWLSIIDRGEYGEGWIAASDYLKKAVDKPTFERAMQGVRQPLGELKSRELVSAKHETSLPGAPDGDYYVIQFKTSFAKKESAVETITPMKTSEGEWKVSGYYIK